LVDVTRSVAVGDDIGGDYDDPEVVASDIECWVQPASDSEIDRFQRREQIVTHKVYFRGSVPYVPGYILTPKNGRATCPFAGATLEVKSKAEATAGTGLLYRVMAEEIQPR
jgi:hypothetical protein